MRSGLGPRDTIAGMKEKGGEKANEFTPEPKPSSPYSTTSTSPGLRPRNAYLVPGMPRGQGVPRPLVPLARLLHSYIRSALCAKIHKIPRIDEDSDH